MSTSKKRKILDDNRQISIFDIISDSRKLTVDDVPGSLRSVDELRTALTNALKGCPLSRHQVAGQMAHLLNEEISKAMIDSWTCESKYERHIPAEYLPAFCRATGNNEPLEVLNRKAGLFAMQGQEALRSEIHKIQAQVKQMQREIRKREQMLDLFGPTSKTGAME